ncbi:sodium:proton antiporter [Modestobacter sp. L9-4]|uniref:cation:proton antiporter n=1 Tax=Modestobacter sp. L9-4 TaxID=2851567 RepID=UPI001C791873|nr:sodium:proton antiporter [Modestobacter sp. L9-4]QXG74604.1 sodium:proton antiporter [Modestobacter sp. L9-4]
MLYLVIGLLAIAAATAAAPRLGVAAPLLLVVLGIAVSLLPFGPTVEIEPEWVLTGVLPPLLYAASAAMPAMEFRREFTAIRGLSVALVVLSAFALGWFFSLVVPGLGLAWGVALGAIVSPTDAVATSIATRLGVSPRVVTMLEGESLLNDATALVLLRAAVAGAAASVSVWDVVGDFAYAVAVAVVLGAVVGKVVLAVRARVTEASVSTVLSFTAPFLAAVPAEELGASGLVAAVVAGLVTGYGAARALPPRHRLSDESNWRTIELVLEGAVFLTMGLQLSTVVDEVHGGLGTAAWVAAAALALTVLVRAAYVALLLFALQRRTRRGADLQPRLTGMQQRLDAGQSPYEGRRGRRRTSPRDVLRMRTRITRGLADIEHFLAEPLGWRDGAVVVWAGMRGAITLAAAQTLPEDTPQRSVLVLVAFLVATGSLLLQGGTLPWVVRAVGATRGEQPGADEERRRLLALMSDAAATVTAPVVSDDPWARLTAAKGHRLAVLDAQRDALLTARDDGAFSSAALTAALAVLDADQLALEMRGAPV